MNSRVVINEVGPRDGLQIQSRVLTVEQRLQLINALVNSGIRSLEAGSFVSPKAVPQMAGTGELMPQLPLSSQVAYAALVPNVKGYELALAAGARRFNVVLSATETMNQKNIRMSLNDTTQVCADIMARSNKAGLQGQAYVAVAFECPYEGLTSQSEVLRLVREMFKSGASKVIIADTIGAANPAQVSSLMTALINEHGADRLSCHFHDTRGMALANVLAALKLGIREFDSSIGGLGGCPFSPGASGNLATEDLALMLQSMGYDTGLDALDLVPVVQLAQSLTGTELGGHSYQWLHRQHQKKLQEVTT